MAHPKRKLISIIFLAGLLYTTPVNADVPIWPVMSLMNVPFIASVASTGKLFLLILLLELPILWKCTSLSLFDSLKFSLLANVYSTFIGVCIAFAYSSGIGALIGAAIGARWFTSMFSDLSKKTGQFSWLAERKKLCMALFLFGGIGVAYLGIEMMPWHGLSSRTTLPAKDLEPRAVIPGTLFLLASGFFLTCISEGYVVARKMTDNRDKIIKTILVMNMASYTFLLFYFIYFFYRHAMY